MSLVNLSVHANRTSHPSYNNMGDAMKKKTFNIRIVPCEGDLIQLIEELVKEKVKGVLSRNPSVILNNSNENFAEYVTGVVENGKKTNSDLL